MKRIFFPIAILLFTASAILSGCRSSAEKVEKAEENVVEALAKLEQARIDSAADEKTKLEWTTRIEDNEKTIIAYRVKIANRDKSLRKADEAKLAELEKRNNELKARMNETHHDDRSKWQIFKTDFGNAIDEFDSDMDAFGEAFENLGRK